MNTGTDMHVHGHPGGLRTSEWVGRLRTGFTRLRERHVKARRRRLAIRDLRSLSDRTLNDIGIARNQIPEVVDGLLARDSGTAAEASRAINGSLPLRCGGACPA